LSGSCKIISKTIEDYEKVYPVQEMDKIPFYYSQTLLEELLKFRLTKKLDKTAIKTAVKEDERLCISGQPPLPFWL